MADEPSVTELIHRAERGDAEAADQLFATMYPELRRLARARLRAGGRNTLLDTFSLVHESYLRFAGAGRLRLQDRAHFMRWAARAMRSVIVDFARRRQALRRGGGQGKITLTTGIVDVASGEAEILRVHRVRDREPRTPVVSRDRSPAGLGAIAARPDPERIRASR